MGSMHHVTPDASAAGLVLRDAQPRELDEVAALLAEVYCVFRHRLPDHAWSSYIGEITDVAGRMQDCELIVAARADRIIGTIGLYPDASRSTLERWPAGWASIRTLAVRADARCHGVGEALARECVRRAREYGRQAVGLHTASHLAAATRLYTRLGFGRVPQFDIEIGEMFAGHGLSADASWQAQAYRLDLKEL